MAVPAFTIQSGDIQTQFQFPFVDAVTGASIPLTGSPTITMIVEAPSGHGTVYTCSIDPTNTYGYYNTTGSEFPVTGSQPQQFTIQGKYVGTYGTHYGPRTLILVNPNLPTS